MSALTGDLRLLRAAVGYALAGTALVTPPLLSHPTPCADWDLDALLAHVTDSMDVLRAGLGLAMVRPGPGAGPVVRLRRQAARLLAACAQDAPADHLIAIGDRTLTARLVIVAGILEITVHGWDIHRACGARRSIPPELASILLPVAPLLVTPGTRDGLFAAPVPLTAPSCPSDQLIAFLGRRPG